MHLLLGMIFLALCLGCMAYAFARPSVFSVFMAVQSLFAIGYYALPILLISRSPLRYLPEWEIAQVALIALLFQIVLVCGFFLAANRIGRNDRFALRLDMLDGIFEKNWWAGAIVSGFFVFYYLSNEVYTIYQASSVEEFMESQSIVNGIIGFIFTFSFSIFAVYFAKALAEENAKQAIFCSLALLAATAMMGGSSSRLMLLTPMLLALGAIVSYRRFRMAGGLLVVVVMALLVASPVLVAMRSGAWTGTQDEQLSNFTYGSDPIDTMLQSIVDRGDILTSTSTLKSYVDANGFVGPTYYKSVFAAPIPRYFYPDKPAILSEDGKQATEASVLAWHLSNGASIGSLTAFGGIIAYREGGWMWLPVNAFLTGSLFAFLLHVFSSGGFIGRSFFAMTFLSWAVRKVPPSLFEALVDVMTNLPIILALIVLNRLLRPKYSLHPDSALIPNAPALPGV